MGTLDGRALPGGGGTEPLGLFGPTRDCQFDPPHRPHRRERALEPHERWNFVRKDPGMVVRWHATEQGGDELEPNPQPGLEHVVGRGLREFADQHLVLACRCQFQLDEPGRGRQGHDVDGLARPLGEVLRDREDHAVVNVRGQVELAVEHFLPPVLAGLGFHMVLPGGSVHREIGVFGEYGAALHQVVFLHSKNSLLGEQHGLVEHRSVFEVKYHAAVDLFTPDDLEDIALRNEGTVDRAQEEISAGDTFDKAHRDRSGWEGGWPQQYRRENQQAEPHRRIHERRVFWMFAHRFLKV